LFKVFPKYFRDVVYKFVAANRHKIFKKNWTYENF
jgi:predicted DCC family thiol-disulfide oxidoreductase YuxK